MWWPLPLFDYSPVKPIPDAIPNCTLVAYPDHNPLREEINRQVKLLVAQAAGIKEVYASYGLSAYHLQGLPQGGIAKLMARDPGCGVDVITQQMGRWAPPAPWGPGELARHLRPAGELLAFTPANPNWRGVRLGAMETTVDGAAMSPRTGRMGAFLLGGDYVSEGQPARLISRLGVGAACRWELVPGEFLLAHLSDDGTSKAARMTLSIPAELAQSRFAPGGDAPAGVYLTWGGWCPLNREDFLRPGFNGPYYDVGPVGDELYLRGGFNESEGMPSSDARWTRAKFALEVAVWPGQAAREVVLLGIYPQAARDRRIRMVADQGNPHSEMSAEAIFDKTTYGEYVLKLPQPLGPGVHRLDFSVGAWSPKEAGLGQDTRQLGFLLDGLGLRVAR